MRPCTNLYQISGSCKVTNVYSQRSTVTDYSQDFSPLLRFVASRLFASRIRYSQVRAYARKISESGKKSTAHVSCISESFYEYYMLYIMCFLFVAQSRACRLRREVTDAITRTEKANRIRERRA